MTTQELIRIIRKPKITIMTTESIKWEYKIEHSRNLTEESLNKMGEDGWELTAVVFYVTSAGGNDYFDYYFKRQIQIS